jgi:hypothetical protein
MRLIFHSRKNTFCNLILSNITLFVSKAKFKSNRFLMHAWFYRRNGRPLYILIAGNILIAPTVSECFYFFSTQIESFVRVQIPFFLVLLYSGLFCGPYGLCLVIIIDL